MKIKLALFVTAVILAAATSAFAAPGRPYFSIFGGAHFPVETELTDEFGQTVDTKFDTGYVVGGSIGYTFPYTVRVEAEFAYRNADFDEMTFPFDGTVKMDSDSSVSTFSMLGSIYYDFRNPSNITPYFGGGIGFANVSVDRGSVRGTTYWYSDDETVFAYQVGGGFGFELGPMTTLDIGYRFFGTDEVHFDVARANFNSHNVTVGIRQSF